MKSKIIAALFFLLIPSFVYAADTLVENTGLATTDTDNTLWGPYWLDKDTGVIVFPDSLNDMNFRKTTDGGASWGAQTEAQAGTVEHASCVHSNQRVGGTAGTVYCVWLESGTNLKFASINISAGTWSSVVTITSGLTVSTTGNLVRVSITQTTGGNLLVAGSTQSNLFAYRSTDSGGSWSSRANPMETATEEDFVMLFPASTSDGADAVAIFQDRSADLLSIKMYDDSADTWTETAMTFGVGITESATFYNLDGAIRHSDGALLICAHQNDVTTTDDIYTAEIIANSISTPTYTVKTNVLTDTNNSSQCSLIINQQTDDVYVGYIVGTAWDATVDAVYKLSTDDMTTWGSQSTYSEDTPDDLKLMQGPRSIGDEGGRVQWSFWNDDLNDIFVNLTNDTEVTAAAGGVERRVFFVN